MAPWIFQAMAWVLGVAGVLLLAWALVGDRARGRRRCPKCWYDLSAARPEGGGVTCPECGKKSAGERSLRRARRRWRWATLACVVLVGAWASRAWHVARVRGWWRVAPDVVVIAFLPRTESWSHPIFIHPSSVLNSQLSGAYRRELYHRWVPIEHAEGVWRHGELNGIERWLLARRAKAWLRQTDIDEFRYVACEMLAWASDENPQGLPPAHLAMLVLARSRLAYAGIDSYTDIGVQVEDLSEIDYELGVQYTPFVTGFDRTGGVRHESVTVSPDDDWSPMAGGRGAVSFRPNGGLAVMWEQGGAYKVDDNEVYAYPVEWHPADAVDPDRLWHSPLTADHGTWHAMPDRVRGRSCYRLTKEWDEMELWIDAETWLVLRVREGWVDIHFEPTTGVDLDESWWRFDPSDPADTPLERRLDDINALLPDVDVLEGYTRRER